MSVTNGTNNVASPGSNLVPQVSQVEQKYSSIGVSITGPIRRTVNIALEHSETLMKKSNEIFEVLRDETVSNDSHQVNELAKTHQDLKKSEIELSALNVYIEKKLATPEFLSEDKHDEVCIKMRNILKEREVSKKIKDIRAQIIMAEMELTNRKRVVDSADEKFDPFETSFKDDGDCIEYLTDEDLIYCSEEQIKEIKNKLIEEADRLKLLNQQQEIVLEKAKESEKLRNLVKDQSELTKKLEEVQSESKTDEQTTLPKVAYDVHQWQETVKTLSTVNANNNASILALGLNSNSKKVLPLNKTQYGSPITVSDSVPPKTSQVVENVSVDLQETFFRSLKEMQNETDKKISVLSQSFVAAMSKLSEDIVKNLKISENKKQDKKSHFSEEVSSDIEEQYMDMVQHCENGVYQNPRNIHSIPPNYQDFAQGTPKNIADILQGEGNYEKSYDNHSMYCDSQSQRNYENYQQKLITFDGTGNLNMFLRVFNDNVVNNPTLTDDDKFIELKDLLLGPAAKCFQDLENPAEAVEKTLYELEQVYRPEVNRMKLHQQFIELPFHDTDSNRMVHDLHAHRSIVNKLLEKKCNVDDERTIIPFCKKLPKVIADEISHILHVPFERLTFAMVHDAVSAAIKTLKLKNTFFNSEIVRVSNEISLYTTVQQQEHQVTDHQSPYPPGVNNNYQSQRYDDYQSQRNNVYQKKGNRQSGNNMNKNSENYGASGHSQKQGRSPLYFKTSIPPSYTVKETGKVLPGIYAPGHPDPILYLLPLSFPFLEPEKYTECNTCAGAHHGMRCDLSSDDFRQMAQAKLLCELCNEEGHTIKECLSTRVCGYCRGLHFMGACPKKEFYRDEENYPVQAKPIVHYEQTKKTFFRSQPKRQ